MHRKSEERAKSTEQLEENDSIDPIISKLIDGSENDPHLTTQTASDNKGDARSFIYIGGQRISSHHIKHNITFRFRQVVSKLLTVSQNLRTASFHLLLTVQFPPIPSNQKRSSRIIDFFF